MGYIYIYILNLHELGSIIKIRVTSIISLLVRNYPLADTNNILEEK